MFFLAYAHFVNVYQGPTAEQTGHATMNDINITTDVGYETVGPTLRDHLELVQNVFSRTFGVHRRGDVIMDSKKCIIVASCSEIESPVIMDQVALHSHAVFVCKGNIFNEKTNTHRTIYKCRLHHSPGKIHGSKKKRGTGQCRPDQSSPMCNCKAYISVTSGNGKATMRMQLIHNSHMPGDAEDIVQLPLREEVKVEIKEALKLTRNPKAIRRWICEWVRATLVKTLDLDFDVVGLDGRFAPTTQMVQNIGTSVSKSYTLSNDDRKNTLMYACQQQTSSWVFRAHSGGNIAYLFDPSIGLQATLVDDKLKIHRIQIRSRWEKEFMKTFPEETLKVSSQRNAL